MHRRIDGGRRQQRGQRSDKTVLGIYGLLSRQRKEGFKEMRTNMVEEKKKINGWTDRWIECWLEQREVRAVIGSRGKEMKREEEANRVLNSF